MTEQTDDKPLSLAERFRRHSEEGEYTETEQAYKDRLDRNARRVLAQAALRAMVDPDADPSVERIYRLFWESAAGFGIEFEE